MSSSPQPQAEQSSLPLPLSQRHLLTRPYLLAELVQKFFFTSSISVVQLQGGLFGGKRKGTVSFDLGCEPGPFPDSLRS